MAGLAIKIDQVAILRESRKSQFPDPAAAALDWSYLDERLRR